MLYLKLATGWILYFAIHSILASDRVKAYCRSHVPAIFPYYRILYNLVALGGLAALAAGSWRDSVCLVTQSSGLKTAGIIFIALGVLMLGVAFASFNVKEFLGLEAETHGPEAKLVTKGVYQYVRHPLYTGIFLMLPGLFLYRPTMSILVFILITTIYIEIGSRLEEQKLVRVFGDDYVRYSQTVKRYFPFIY